MSLRRGALVLAGLAVAGMAALAVGATDAVGLTTTDHSTPGQSTATVDRDPHSNAPVMPTNICPDTTLPCGDVAGAPGQTH